MKKYKCFRCDYSWLPRVSKPLVCPKCKSPYWKRPRVIVADDDFDLIKPDNITDVMSDHEIGELPDLREIIKK